MKMLMFCGAGVPQGSSLGLLLNPISLKKMTLRDDKASAKPHLCSLVTPLAYLAPDPPP